MQKQVFVPWKGTQCFYYNMAYSLYIYIYKYMFCKIQDHNQNNHNIIVNNTHNDTKN